MPRRMLVTVLITCALLGTACGKPAEGPAPEQERTPAPTTETTTIRVAYRRTTDTTLSAEFDAFQERFPQYRIEPITFLDEDPLELVKEQRVDVIVPVNPGYPPSDLFTSGLLLDLGPYLQSTEMDLSAFGGLLEASRHEGKQVALPYAADMSGKKFDNRALFQLGIAQPEAPRTWQDFRQTLRELTKEVDGVRVYGYAANPNESLVVEYLISKAGDVLHAVSESDLREAISFFEPLIFIDQSIEVSQPRDFVRMEGLLSGSRNVTPPLSSGRATDMVTYPVFPTPAYNENTKPVVRLSPVMVGIAANTPVPEAAWAFVQFLVGEGGATMTARRGRVPAYYSEAVRQAWQERPSPRPETDLLFDAIRIAPIISEEQALLVRTIQNAANRVFSGAMTVDESIAQWRLDIASIGQ